MMKRFIAFFVAFILVGCSNTINFKADLERNINEEVINKAFSPSNNKDYYSYYISPSLGMLYSDKTTNVLTYQNEKIIMNLNTSAIINSVYYTDALNVDGSNPYKGFSIDGVALNYKNEEVKYIYNVYKYEDMHILELDSTLVNIVSQSNDYDLLQISRYMMQILKSFNIKQENILMDYSSKETIEFSKENIEIFEQIVPVDGKINDILEGSESIDNNSGDNYVPADNNDNNINESDDNYQSDDYQQH